MYGVQIRRYLYGVQLPRDGSEKSPKRSQQGHPYPSGGGRGGARARRLGGAWGGHDPEVGQGPRRDAHGLYWHFRSKDDLLDGMAARIFEEVDLSVDESARWQEQLRALLGSMLGGLRARPSTAILLSTRTTSSDGSLRATEAALDILRRGGFSPAEATQTARHALSTLTNLVSGEPGVVAREESGELLDARRRARLFLESLPPERYPRLVEAARPLSEGVDPDAYYAFGLDLLLAGIEAMAARKR